MTGPPETNMDSPDFKPEEYLQHITRERKFDELAKEAKEIGSSVLSLRTELQMHIYGNYSQFIEAADKIRDMKEGVGSLEANATDLVESMNVISEKSAAINQNLSAGRKKIEELSGVKKFLRQLKFVLDVPSKIHAAIDLNNFSEAMRLYDQTRDVLNAYAESKPAVAQAKAETERAVSRLRTKLRRRLDDDTATMVDMADCVKFLSRLGEGSKDLMRKFMANSKEKIENVLRAVDRQRRARSGSIMGAGMGVGKDKMVQQNPVEHFSAIVDAFLPDFFDFITTFRLYFFNEDEDDKKDKVAKDNVGSEEGYAEELDVKSELIQACRFLFQSFLSRVRPIVQLHIADYHALLVALEKYLAGVRRVHALLTDAKLMTFAEAFVLATVKLKIADCLYRSRKEIEITLRSFSMLVAKSGLGIATEATSKARLISRLDSCDEEVSVRVQEYILPFSTVSKREQSGSTAAKGGVEQGDSAAESPFASISRALSSSIVESFRLSLSKCLVLCRGKSKCFRDKNRKELLDMIDHGVMESLESIALALQQSAGCFLGVENEDDMSEEKKESEKKNEKKSDKQKKQDKQEKSTEAGGKDKSEDSVKGEDVDLSKVGGSFPLSLSERERQILLNSPPVLLLLYTLGEGIASYLKGSLDLFVECERTGRLAEAEPSLSWLFPWTMDLYPHGLPIRDLKKRLTTLSNVSSEMLRIYVHRRSLKAGEHLRDLFASQDWTGRVEKTLVFPTEIVLVEDIMLESVRDCAFVMNSTAVPSRLHDVDVHNLDDSSFLVEARRALRRGLDHDDFSISKGITSMFDEDTKQAKKVMSTVIDPCSVGEQIVCALMVILREVCRRLHFSKSAAEEMETNILALYYLCKPFSSNLPYLRKLVDKAGMQVFERCSGEPDSLPLLDLKRMLDLERGNWL
uniref:Vacuolar protein sorting-associated protein 51 homolog n=1 Tax=Palpitomonas bilix TaxID=652834 RepID=A0A7S3D632_9EUKA|mmetsp:Transcript_23640/g.59540  ORF Transcript_23640/g.59540 Transcript_23640/m.59540 type:complete len:915 (+) Transcript_23640:143-2887(+)